MGTKVNGVVGGMSESVPKGPPTTGRVREGAVIGVFGEEMAVIGAISGACERGWVEKGLSVVDLDEVPTGSKSASRAVRNKEEAVR